ncbi:helix-turn-helix domain-containing protein [Silvimonas sp.]|uniref:helix-turn-helix domain-containing protein n=1 Tax=Silvimonas sp. TaxID=2650811 RepID=UPI00284EAECE|nr:helix-turn-helix domain-containing protein [Silvimonas sp.]MDR3429701.1 helix-turn-helix domain-containing protein [Silvimonas sp.]
MSSIGERLKNERKRLGMNQAEFAALGGVQRTAQSNYEIDGRAPDAIYLAAITQAGVDVLYVLTGVRSNVSFAPDAMQLLASYEAASPAVRAAALAALLSGSSPASPKMVVHGDVGQTVKGNVTIEGGFSMGGRKK